MVAGQHAYLKVFVQLDLTGVKTRLIKSVQINVVFIAYVLILILK